MIRAKPRWEVDASRIVNAITNDDCELRGMAYAERKIAEALKQRDLEIEGLRAEIASLDKLRGLR